MFESADDLQKHLATTVSVRVRWCECTSDCGEATVTETFSECDVTPEEVVADVSVHDVMDMYRVMSWSQLDSSHSHGIACRAIPVECSTSGSISRITYEIIANVEP